MNVNFMRSIEEILKPENMIIVLFILVIFMLAQTQPANCTNNTNPQENFTPEDSISGYDYKGCYVEKSATPSIPNKIGKVSNISECIKKAKVLGHNVIGYQNGDVCYSGVDPNYSKYGKQSNSKCNLDSIGSGTNIVYIKNTTPVAPTSTTSTTSTAQECPKPTIEYVNVSVPTIEIKEVVKQEYIKQDCPEFSCPKQEETICPTCGTCPEQQKCATCPICPTCQVCAEIVSEDFKKCDTDMMPYYGTICFLVIMIIILCLLYMSTSCPVCKVSDQGIT